MQAQGMSSKAYRAYPSPKDQLCTYTQWNMPAHGMSSGEWQDGPSQSSTQGQCSMQAHGMSSEGCPGAPSQSCAQGQWHIQA